MLQWTTKDTIESGTWMDKAVQSKACKFRAPSPAGLASHIAGLGLGQAQYSKSRLQGSLTQCHGRWNQTSAGVSKWQLVWRFKRLDCSPPKLFRVPSNQRNGVAVEQNLLHGVALLADGRLNIVEAAEGQA
jgi:hypothetical protein